MGAHRRPQEHDWFQEILKRPVLLQRRRPRWDFPQPLPYIFDTGFGRRLPRSGTLTFPHKVDTTPLPFPPPYVKETAAGQAGIECSWGIFDPSPGHAWDSLPNIAASTTAQGGSASLAFAYALAEGQQMGAYFAVGNGWDQPWIKNATYPQPGGLPYVFEDDISATYDGYVDLELWCWIGYPESAYYALIPPTGEPFPTYGASTLGAAVCDGPPGLKIFFFEIPRLGGSTQMSMTVSGSTTGSMGTLCSGVHTFNSTDVSNALADLGLIRGYLQNSYLSASAVGGFAYNCTIAETGMVGYVSPPYSEVLNDGSRSLNTLNLSFDGTTLAAHLVSDGTPPGGNGASSVAIDCNWGPYEAYETDLRARFFDKPANVPVNFRVWDKRRLVSGTYQISSAVYTANPELVTTIVQQTIDIQGDYAFTTSPLPLTGLGEGRKAAGHGWGRPGVACGQRRRRQ